MKNYIGQKFGRLEVISETYRKQNRKSYYN